jgi:addiction module HigA family antidote
MLSQAHALIDLQAPPGNHLELLKGDWAGYYSIRINSQWRIVFRWEDHDASQVAFARHIGVPTQRVNEIVRGKRGVTPETAWLFAQAFGTTPQFWMNLQTAYDLSLSRPSRTGKSEISVYPTLSQSSRSG